VRGHCKKIFSGALRRTCAPHFQIRSGATAYRLHATSASPYVDSRGINSPPLLRVRYAVRPTFWDLDMFPWTFPSDIFPDNQYLK